jgi:small redox-active disulfide protein 2
MEIKILGGGCPKCKVLYNNVNSACRELSVDAKITKVEDYADIASYGVMTTPALVIDEKVVAFGKLNYKKVKELIGNA